jgi:hypothetical protein
MRRVIAVHDEGQARWRKSSYSGNDANCVELAWLPAGAGIRDSKAPEAGALTVSPTAYATLLTRIKQA